MAGSNPAGRVLVLDGGRSSVGRVPDCDSGCRGFDPHRSPHLKAVGPLAQLVEQLTLNQRVVGSIPTRPIILIDIVKFELPLISKNP